MKSATESKDVKEERIMTIKRIAISIAVLLMGGLFAATAEAEPINLHFAGSSVTNALGIGVSTSKARGAPQGSTALQVQTEFGPFFFPGPNCVSPPFVIQLDLIQGSIVSTGDDLSQWTGFFEEGFVCADITGTGKFTIDLDGIVNGGSGRFENATGTFHTSLSGRFVVPLLGPGFQNFFTGTTVGIIN